MTGYLLCVLGECTVEDKWIVFIIVAVLVAVIFLMIFNTAKRKTKFFSDIDIDDLPQKLGTTIMMLFVDEIVNKL